MFLKDKKNFLLVLIIVTLLLSLISLYVDYLFTKVIIGLIVVLFIKIKDLDQNLSDYQLKFFYFFIFIYPFIEVILKVLTQDFYTSGTINLFYILINSLEHVLAGMGVGIVLLPFIIPTLLKLNQKEKFVFFVSVTVLVCVFYELSGFYMYFNPLFATSQNAFYPDTMRDISMNILGAIGIFILIFKNKE